MHVTVTFRHIPPSDALRDYATRKIERLGKFYDGIVDAHVILETERGRHFARVTINAAGSALSAVEASQDMYGSIDLLADKVYRQLKKLHDKRRTKNIRKSRKAVRALAGVPAGKAGPAEEAAEGGPPRIVARSTAPLRPMFPDDAALEIDRTGYAFYVFLNAETDRLNVIYRRPDGNLGLIEPVGA